MWDLSSPTRDQTRAPCSGSMESSPLDRQGSPKAAVLTRVVRESLSKVTAEQRPREVGLRAEHSRPEGAARAVPNSGDALVWSGDSKEAQGRRGPGAEWKEVRISVWVGGWMAQPCRPA